MITIELDSDDISEDLGIWQLPRGEEDSCAVSVVQGYMVAIRDSIVGLIPNDLIDVMDRSLVSIDEGSVRKITVSGQKNQVFTKKAGAWYRGEQRFHEPHLTPGFDIVVYSQYGIGLDDGFYRINKGGMKTVYGSLDMLLK